VSVNLILGEIRRQCGEIDAPGGRVTDPEKGMRPQVESATRDHWRDGRL